MPLVHSSSDAAFKTNVAEMIRAGHPRDQALAASYRVKRGKANGGVAGFAFGGAPMPPQMPQLPPQAMQAMQMARTAPMGAAPAQMPPQAMQNVAGFAPQAMPFMQHRGFAFGGAPAPWFVKNEARSMMHGPVNSAVPGRTDRHNVSVAAGSYVLPSSHVSFLGQDNTAAGHSVISRMFSSGPYGTGNLKIAHGPGAPKATPPHVRAPAAPKSAFGGARGDESPEPVDIVVAGGEHILTPDQVSQVGGGDLGRGHAILDAWVKSSRKKHIQTLQQLPGPAKK